MEEYYIYSLFVGDDARYDYIADVCGTRNLRGGWKTADVKFVHGAAYSEKEGDGMMYITSPFVPPGCCYFFPKDGMAGGVKHPKEYRAVYIFEEFPFGKGTVSRLLEKGEGRPDGEGAVGLLVKTGRVQDYNSVVVLYWKDRRFGLDNMVSVQEARPPMPPSREKDAAKEQQLRSAKKRYEGKCAKVIVYDETNPEREMILGRGGLDYGFVRRVKYRYHRDFKDCYQEFVSHFQTDYGMDVEEELTGYTKRNMELLNQLFDYSNVKKAKTPLWKFYVQSYEKEVFCDGLRDVIEDLCDKYLGDIYGSRRIAEISGRIYSKWKEDYQGAFINPPSMSWSVLRKITMEKVPDSELEYEKLAAESNVISIFERQRDRFWGRGGRAEKICHDIIFKELEETRRVLEKK